MSERVWLALICGFGLLIIILYWELVLAEGTHLGTGVVVRLYDWTAKRYEDIKSFQPEFEDHCLGLPLARLLASVSTPLVLDVAAGTGRLARTLIRQTTFDGRVVALDMSEGMLRQVYKHIPERSEHVGLLLGTADGLPFACDTFEAVACLEVLEFTPDLHAVLAECERVLRPGGQLVVSNRIGPEARWLVGKTVSSPGLEGLLSEIGLHVSRVDAWQVDYDLAWATKPATEVALERGLSRA